MSPAHLANIVLHVAAGTFAMALGFTILAQAKGTATHRRLGRWFCALTLAVCALAALGLLWFRFLPVFAALALLVAYQLLSGWHAAFTQTRGPDAWDAGLTAAAIAVAAALAPSVLAASGSSRAVTYASMGGLAFVLMYDIARWALPRR